MLNYITVFNTFYKQLELVWGNGFTMNRFPVISNYLLQGTPVPVSGLYYVWYEFLDCCHKWDEHIGTKEWKRISNHNSLSCTAPQIDAAKKVISCKSIVYFDSVWFMIFIETLGNNTDIPISITGLIVNRLLCRSSIAAWVVLNLQKSNNSERNRE